MVEYARDRSKGLLRLPMLVSLDVLCIMAALSICTVFTWKSPDLARLIATRSDSLILIMVITLLNFYIFDLYYIAEHYRRFHQLINIIEAIVATFFLMTFIAFFDKSMIIGRRMLGAYSLLMFIFALIMRSMYSVLTKRYLYKNAVIIGNNHLTGLVAEAIGAGEEGSRNFGIRLLGYVSDDGSHGKGSGRQIMYLGAQKDMSDILASVDADLIIYALDQQGNARLNELLIKEKLKGVDIISAIGLYQSITGRVPYEQINSAWLIEDCLRGNKFTEVRLKRLFDILLGTILAAFSIPLILLCAIIIKLESKGPAIFVQERVGRYGRRFKIYKLRTMAGAPGRDRPGWKRWINLYKKHSGKITRFGKLIRKYHIDELPQFYNVLKGDMSIIGPRPEMETFTHRCEKRIPFYRLRLSIRPGITGWAQVWFHHTSTLSGYKRKFEYDLYYLEHGTLKLDFEILIRTIFRVIGYPMDRGRTTIPDDV